MIYEQLPMHQQGDLQGIITYIFELRKSSEDSQAIVRKFTQGRKGRGCWCERGLLMGSERGCMVL
jgi:hypothetical protein